MNNNSLLSYVGSFEPPSINAKDGHLYVNIPIAGIHDRRLDSEKYKNYKTFNNFCLFRILYQSELTNTNSTHVSVAASDLWRSVPEYFKNILQNYCNEINSEKRTFHFKSKLYDRKDYDKPRTCRNKKSNDPYVI